LLYTGGGFSFESLNFRSSNDQGNVSDFRAHDRSIARSVRRLNTTRD
jgi:hypothetical protein